MSSAEPDPVDVAIAALTAAARPVDTTTGTVRQADMGEVLCYVATVVAANLGGVDALLSDRPGSWEADLVRQMVENTGGGDLSRYRRSPVVLRLDPEQVFSDLGYETLRDQAERDLDADGVDLDADGVVSEVGEQQITATNELLDALERVWQTDLDRFVATFTAGAQAAAAARDLTVPVQVLRVVDVDAGPPEWDEVTEGLREAGLEAAVLPSGRRRGDYPTGRQPGDVDSEDPTRSYLARATAVIENRDRA